MEDRLGTPYDHSDKSSRSSKVLRTCMAGSFVCFAFCLESTRKQADGIDISTKLPWNTQVHSSSTRTRTRVQWMVCDNVWEAPVQPGQGHNQPEMQQEQNTLSNAVALPETR
eukprot:10472872-Alexandrium_andersonii.AAC.1